MMNSVTQELFDEATIENEECFSLTPEEALLETMDQLVKQCRRQGRSPQTSLSRADEVSIYLGHLLLSHPRSEQGLTDREQCKLFLNCLAELDRCCNVQSTISDGIGVFAMSFSEEMSQKIINCVKTIQESCLPAMSSMSSFLEFEKSKVTAEVDTSFASELKSEVGEEASIQDYSASIATATKSRRVYLNLFQVNGGMDKVVSLLQVLTKSANILFLKGHIRVFEALVSCFVAIFRQERYPEVALIIHSFSGWDQITTILDGIGSILYPSSRSTTKASNDEIYRDSTMEALGKLLPSVYYLCQLACKGCEKSKVHFIQSRSSFQSYDSNEIAVGGVTKKRNSVHVIVQTLDSISFLLQKQLNGNYGSSDHSISEIRTLNRICNAITAACRCDDKHSQVSSAHDHAMEFYRAGMVKVLHNILFKILCILEKETPLNGAVNQEIREAADSNNKIRDNEHARLILLQLLCSIMSAIRVTCINDDIVQGWVSVGLLRSIQDVLVIAGYLHSLVETRKIEDIGASPTQFGNGIKMQLLSDAMGVIRNICGNDEIKTTICQDGKTLPLLFMHGMRHFRCVPSVQEHGCGIIAAMALRSLSNAQRMMAEYDVGKDIVMALRCHPANAKVQRQGALAIRNLASQGDIAIKEALIDLGIEDLLRNTTGMLPNSLEEAYAALRDLGCKVSMIHYTLDDNGKVTRSGTVQMFGEVKPKFRATFEATHDDIADMISNQATLN